MLLEFYGTECPHCLRMAPKIERLEKETAVKVEKYEVWHNDENAAKMREYDKGLCGGVPFFFNTDTGKYICGEDSYENLKVWAGK
ncbi:MAG: thioredoxin family protein [Candidatus Liptonbacteria bacterium]|nr:thioredoxin family protein [Candidatus Liptonbacteria bacterium]